MSEIGGDTPMQSITLHTRIDEHHQIILDVPKDLPIGEVVVTIRPVENLTREEVRARLKAAGLLVEITDDDPEWQELKDIPDVSDEELKRIGRLLAQGKTLQEMIDEERGE